MSMAPLLPVTVLTNASLFLACAVGAQALQAGRAPIGSEDCLIEGSVVNSVTGEPIPKAALVLGRSGDSGSSRIASTDEAGRFAFQDLEAGGCVLIAQGTGFATPHSPFGLSSSINRIALDTGQAVSGLILKLTPGATLSGRILDGHGEPMPGASVVALRPASQRGLGQWSRTAAVTTDASGRFRVTGLWAGRYLLAANSGTGYSTTYLPGATNPAAATPITVGVGEKTEVPDLRLMKEPVVRVRGRVTWPPSFRPSTSGLRATIWLSPVGSVVPITDPLNWSAGVRDDGSFEIDGVPRGLYNLVALSPSPLATRQTLQVGTQNVEGVNLELHAGVNLLGRVITEDGSPLSVKSTVRLQPSLLAEVRGGKPRLDSPSGQTGEGGRFTVGFILPDRYRLEVRDLPSDSYVKSVRVGGQELIGDWLDFSAEAVKAPLEIVLGKAGSRVYGSVLGKDGKPSGGATVVLAPRPMSYSILKATRTDGGGRFIFTEVSPGEYSILAWEDFEPGAYEDLDFLRCYEPAAQSLSLGENEAKAVSLKAVQTECAPR